MDGQGKPDVPKVRVIRNVQATASNRQKDSDNQQTKPKRIEAAPSPPKTAPEADKPASNGSISTILANNVPEKSDSISEANMNPNSQENSNNVVNIQDLLSTPVQQPQKAIVTTDLDMLVNRQPQTEPNANNNKPILIQNLLQASEPQVSQAPKVTRTVSVIKKAEPIKVATIEKKPNMQSSPLSLLNIQNEIKPPMPDSSFATNPYSLQSMINVTSKPAAQIQPAPHTKVVNPVVVKVQPKIVLPAAPLPDLPMPRDVAEQITSLDKQIAEIKAQIKEYENERIYGMISAPNTSDAPAESAIQDFHGSIFPHSTTANIIEQNKEILRRSTEKHALPEPLKRYRYTHITHLPHYLQEDENSHDNAEPILHTICQRINMTDQKAKKLALEYKDRYQLWNESNKYLTVYHKELHDKIDRWPPEFDKCLQYIKPNDKTNTVNVAPDQIMYLDDLEKETYLYYDENNFVEDPEAEHLAFKNRISWTENEKQTFLDKYTQHPREFKKIAAALPLKTIKDVIEYYNINRIKLDLGAIEKSHRKRGRRKEAYY